MCKINIVNTYCLLGLQNEQKVLRQDMFITNYTLPEDLVCYLLH
jgi:hypothetical protein